MPVLGKVGTGARYALGVIRIVNGAIGLAAPAVIMRRFGENSPASNPAANGMPSTAASGAIVILSSLASAPGGTTSV